jgi:hypothetical protein
MGLYGDADIVVTRDVPYERVLRYKGDDDAYVDWTQFTWLCQARLRDTTLVFDFTPFLAVDPDDHTRLVLTIPAEFTYAVPHDAKWDLLASSPDTAFRTPYPAGRTLRVDGQSHV